MTAASVDLLDLLPRIESTVEAGHVRAASVQEKVRLLEPLKRDGSTIHILDESSEMHTRSFKAVTALMCVADCLRRGIDSICFSSGANTGMALTSYANRVGIRTHFFIPSQNLSKLDPRCVDSPLSHIHPVEDPSQTKWMCDRFACETGMSLMPENKHWLDAARLRGAAIERLMEECAPCDWLAQTVCAGFGPIGIYDYLVQQHEKGCLKVLPRFLAVQQSANCALGRHLQSRLGPTKVVLAEDDNRPIEEIMYDFHPETYGTFADMESVLRTTDGLLLVLGYTEYNRLFVSGRDGTQVLEHLERCGVEIAMRPGKNEPRELMQKAGLIAILGAMKAARIGLLPKRSSVLCAFGAGAAAGVTNETRQVPFVTVSERSECPLGRVVSHAVKREGYG